ncbi:MAG: S8 family serine peptidase [Phycisphaerales bacterium JB065]
MSREETYIVVRAELAEYGPMLLGDSQTPSSAKVTISEVDSEDLPEVRRERGVIGIVPSIPVSLVEPIRVATSPGEAWGLDAIGARTTQLTGRGASVAVLDTGIDRDHEAFNQLRASLVERDFTGEGDGDRHGHGTHVAGTIFGNTVDGRRIGVAPGVDRCLVGKILDHTGRGSTGGVLKGMQWACESGADIISMSIGLDFVAYMRTKEDQLRRDLKGAPPEAVRSIATSVVLQAYRGTLRVFDTLAASIRARAIFDQRACLIIAAAGNESRRDLLPEWEVTASPPAAADGVVAVGAIDRAGHVAPFSNSGPAVVAPGVDVLSARAGGGLAVMSGTSMAAPHVAGVAALWVEKLQGKGSQADHEILAAKVRMTARVPNGSDPNDVGGGTVYAPQE